MTHLVRLVCVSLILACGCGGTSQPNLTDAGGTDGSTDTGVHDSGHTDGQVADTGMAMDSNVVLPDTGVDAGTTPVDAGPIDAGFDACPGSSATATAAQVCTEFCVGSVAMFCSGGTVSPTCMADCLTAHVDGQKTASQRGNILACAQAVTSGTDCFTFGTCYSVATSCP